MKSVVGNISYNCPELVQGQPYTEKADIWSIGCILYQMAALKAPFVGTNPLFVAQSIVQGVYDEDPLQNYTRLVRKVIRSCLTVDPKHRPSILKVSSLISPLLMMDLDRATELASSLVDELKAERKKWVSCSVEIVLPESV